MQGELLSGPTRRVWKSSLLYSQQKKLKKLKINSALTHQRTKVIEQTATLKTGEVDTENHSLLGAEAQNQKTETRASTGRNT